MKSVSELNRNFPRVHEMRASEGVAVVEHVAMVCEVQGCQAYRPIFSEGFAQSEIERGMRGQVRGAVSIEKAGAIIGIEIGRHTPWKLEVEASRKGVTLIVIEKEVTLLGRRKVSEPAGDSTSSLRVLMRISKMEFCAASDYRRIDAAFPAANPRVRDRKWKEDIGIPQHVVIKKVSGTSPEIGYVKCPGVQRNG